MVREGKVLSITPEAFAAYRSAFRSLGPRHVLVDRWRHDLRWSVPADVIYNYLALERAKLVERAGHA